MKKVMEIIAISGLLTGLLLAVHYWSVIPDSVPAHFNAAGIPTRFGPKTDLIRISLYSFFTYVLLSIIGNRTLYNFFKPLETEYRLRRYALVSALVLILKPVLTWFTAYMIYTMIMVSLGRSDGMGAFALPVFLILTAVPTIVIVLKCN